MPQETPTTWPWSGRRCSAPILIRCWNARWRATKLPVMAAVRVPPSAWITSQSILTWRSPRPGRSVTARRLRPIRRWISWVRPLWAPRVASRLPRVPVARGSMPYSAVTQPRPLLRRNGGTEFSTDAVQSTWVSPNLTRQEPSAYLFTPGSRKTGRISSAARPWARMSMIPFQKRPSVSKYGRNLTRGGMDFQGTLALTLRGSLTTFRQAHECTVFHAAGDARAERALARDLPANRRRLCRERRARRLAHDFPAPGHQPVAGDHPQRHVGPGGGRAALRAPHLGRAPADGAWPPALGRRAPGSGPLDRRRTDGDRGPMRRGRAEHGRDPG